MTNGNSITSTKTIAGAKIKMETFKAYLVAKNGKEVWIPKSQVKELEVDNVQKNERGQYVDTDIVFMEIPEWLANKGNVKEVM